MGTAITYLATNTAYEMITLKGSKNRTLWDFTCNRSVTLAMLKSYEGQTEAAGSHSLSKGCWEEEWRQAMKERDQEDLYFIPSATGQRAGVRQTRHQRPS